MAKAEIFLYGTMDIFKYLITIQSLPLAHHKSNFHSCHIAPNASFTHIDEPEFCIDGAMPKLIVLTANVDIQLHQ